MRLLVLALLGAAARAHGAPVEVVARVPISVGWAPATPVIASAAAPLALSPAPALAVLPAAAIPVPLAPTPLKVQEAPISSLKTVVKTIGPVEKADAGTLSTGFDGALKLKATGGTVELERSGTAQTTRRLKRGRYEVRGDGFSGSFALKAGVLKADFSGDETRAAAELSRALTKFGAGVRAVEGVTSEQAAAAGFTVAIVSETDPSKILFVKPEDARTGRAGGLWRRTFVKGERRGVWSRYEKDGRSVWLLERREGKDFSIYEFAGEELPPPGTPTTGLAIFSAKDGKLAAYSAGAPSLLDPDSERGGAAAYFGITP